MDVKVLGPLEVKVDGRVINLSGQRQRGLLAALVLDHGKVVSVDRLVDVLWDASPPATARARVQTHICSFRQAIGPSAAGLLLTRPPGYLLCPLRVDFAEFDSLAAQGGAAAAAGQAETASDLLSSALSLWRGSAFADVTSPSMQSAAIVLAERRLLAQEAKFCVDLSLRRFDAVLAELPAWVVAHPLRERLRALLMLAFYRFGCRADALAVYRQGRQVMVAELGLEPGPQLRRLHQRILSDDPVLQQGTIILDERATTA